MTTLLHQAVERALAGLLHPPLRDLVIEYIGIISINLYQSVWELLVNQKQPIKCSSLPRRLVSYGQVVEFFLESSKCFVHADDNNPDFSCELTFSGPLPYQGYFDAHIDPDANKIISYDDITPSYRKSTPRPSYSSSS
jgi:hypothetical protein